MFNFSCMPPKDDPNNEKEPPAWEGKRFKLEQSENFDEYMKALGVGPVLRKIGNSVTPIVELEKLDSGWYAFTTSSSFEDTSIKFRLGEPFDEMTIDGRKARSIITIDENCMFHEQKCPVPTSILREFGEDIMTATFQIGDVRAVRTYRVYNEEDEEGEEEGEGENAE